MRAEKKQLVRDIGKLLESSDHVFFVGYKGLKVKQFSELRASLNKVGAECHVVPNRLVRKAAEFTGLTGLADQELTEDNAMISGGSDTVAVAKVLRDFTRGNDKVTVKLGSLSGRVLNVADIQELALLPSREVILAQLLGVLQAPARNLVGVLSAKTSSIVYALKAYMDKQQQ